MNFDEIQRRSRELFRQEAADLLAELEQSLLSLEREPGDTEAIDRVFRAMHTLKGSGATSGFAELSAFLHHVEDVFNAAREGRVAVDSTVVDLTLRLCDVIARYLEATPEDAPAVLHRANDDLEALLRFLPPKAAVAKAPPKPELAAAAPAPAAETPHWEIRFRPHGGVFLQGVDPGMFLDGLRAMGQCEVAAHLEDLPPLGEMDPERCHLAWDLRLATNEPESAIREVFSFIEDDCDLDLVRADADGGAARTAGIWYLEFDVTPALLETPGAAEGVWREIESLGSCEVLESPAGADRRTPGRWRVALTTDSAKERVEDAFLFAVDANPRIGREPFGNPAPALAPKAVAPEAGPGCSGAPPRKEAAAAALAAVAGAKREMLKVSADKLDRLVNLVGELVILKSQVSEGCSAVPDLPPMLQDAAEGLQRLAFELRDVVLGVRMMPIGETFAKFRRLTRDLSRDLGKEVELTIEGADTEMDKTMLDQLADPLMHLVRNSLDHGIETPEARAAAGKPRTATLTLRAEQRGDRVWIVVADDGRGLDAAKIRSKAIERGLLAPEANLSDQEIYQYIMLPGFSTADRISEVSGRGVGLDVVKRNIEALRGTIELRSQPGRGAEIRLSLPLTLAIIEGLMVRVADDRYILPLSSARETIELRRERRLAANGRNVVELRGEMMPYVRMREVFDYPGEPPPIERIVIVELDDRRIGLAVDEVLGNHQTVLKSLGWLSRRVDVFTGATVLGDGRVALIIDIPGLVAFDAARVTGDIGLGAGLVPALA